MIETRDICPDCGGSGHLTELGRKPLEPRACIACKGSGSVTGWVPVESVRLFDPAPAVMPGQSGLFA